MTGFGNEFFGYDVQNTHDKRKIGQLDYITIKNWSES